MPNGDRPKDEDEDESDGQEPRAFTDSGRRGEHEGEFSGLNRFGPGAGEGAEEATGRRRRQEDREEPRQRRDQGNGSGAEQPRRGEARREGQGHIPVPHSEDKDRPPRSEGRTTRQEGRQDRQRDARDREEGGRRQAPPRGTMGADGAEPSRQPAPDQGGASPPSVDGQQSTGGAASTDAPSPRRSRTSAAQRADESGGVLGGLLGSDDTPDYQPYEWTRDDQAALEDTLLSMHHDDAPLLEVRPPRENDGMDAFEEILANIHRVEIKRGKNVSKQHAHEIWYDEGQVQFHFQPANKPISRTIKKQIRSAYPNAGVSEVVTTEETVRELFPLIQPGDYVSAADFRLKQPFYYPIRSTLAGEQDPLETDPYQYILTDMDQGSAETASGERVHSDDVRILAQVVLEPARKQWSKGGLYGANVANLAHDLKEKRLAERSPLGLGNIPLVGWMFKSWEEQDPNKRQKREAELVASVEGKSAFHMSVRVLAISPYEEFARQRAELIAQDMETYYNSFTEQGLYATPLEPDEIPSFVTQAAVRRHEKGRLDRVARLNSEKLVQPIDAVAGLVHLPRDDINVPAVNWATQDVGPGVPSATPQGEEELAELYEEDEDDDVYEQF
jgi:hypothetical protein